MSLLVLGRRRRARRWGCAEGEERARSAGVPTGAAVGDGRGPKARLESVEKVLTPLPSSGLSPSIPAVAQLGRLDV